MKIKMMKRDLIGEEEWMVWDLILLYWHAVWGFEYKSRFLVGQSCHHIDSNDLHCNELTFPSQRHSLYRFQLPIWLSWPKLEKYLQ